MGDVRAKVTLSSMDKTRVEELELLVDTGSFLTWIPETMAIRLAIEPSENRRFRTIEGNVIERPVGDARIACQGRQAITIVVFARPGDAHVLGVYALEGMGFEVDPTTRTLRKVDAFPAYASLSRPLADL